jgi:Uma2 family endonuclease
MIAEPIERLISAEEFILIAQLPENADKSLELIEGVVVEMVKPGGKHGGVTMKLGRKIGNWVEERDLGYVTAAETGFILGQKASGKVSVRGLDIAFIAKDRLPNGLPEGHIRIAPDLAVEVISPGNDAGDIQRKVRELLHAGCRLIWVVYPATQTIEVITSAGSHTLEAADTLAGGEVLPGFTLTVRDVFAV